MLEKNKEFYVNEAVNLINKFINDNDYDFVHAHNHPYDDGIMIIGDGGVDDEVIEHYETLVDSGAIMLEKNDLDVAHNDEYDTCHDCGKVVSLTDPTERLDLDGERVCTDCLQDREDMKEKYVKDELINNYNLVNTILDKNYILSLGFKEYGDYRVGYHEGDDEYPEDVIREAHNAGYKEVVFNLSSDDMFTTEYQALVK